MVDCNYEAYRENSRIIREKTNAFYERALVLNKSLDENMASKPAVKDDSGMSGAEEGTVVISTKLEFQILPCGISP